MLTWSVLVTCVTCTVLVTARPQRIRFPDQPFNRQSQDDGTIFVPGGPARNNVGRALNPLVNTIPREPLTLADPDQFLNAWQFYYPPGPPPTTQDDFDAEGSDLPATLTVRDSAQSGAVFDQPRQSPEQPAVQLTVQPIIQLPVQHIIQLPVHEPAIQSGEQFHIQPEVVHRVPAPVIISPAVSGVQPQPETIHPETAKPESVQPETLQPETAKPATLQSETEQHHEKQSTIQQSVKEQTEKENGNDQSAKASSQEEQLKLEAPEKVEHETEKLDTKSKEKLTDPRPVTADQQASTSNVALEKVSSAQDTQTVAKAPPDFKPRFEAGGWTPLEAVSGLL